jgi:hypothetical protein
MHKKNAQHRFANTAFFFQGELQSVDGYMNIALEGTREFVDGKMRRSYGDAFVRGNNGIFCLFPLLCDFSHKSSFSRILESEISLVVGSCLARKSYVVWRWLADIFFNEQ